MGCEIDHALNAVLELKMQAIIAERFCGDDILQHDLDHIKTLETRGAEATGIGLAPAVFPQKRPISRRSARKNRTLY
jgi:hypothetical protein